MKYLMLVVLLAGCSEPRNPYEEKPQKKPERVEAPEALKRADDAMLDSAFTTITANYRSGATSAKVDEDRCDRLRPYLESIGYHLEYTPKHKKNGCENECEAVSYSGGAGSYCLRYKEVCKVRKIDAACTVWWKK